MIRTEVVHEGIASVIHIKAAKTNKAIVRCCNTVKSLIPKTVEGKNQMTKNATMDMISPISLLLFIIVKYYSPNVATMTALMVCIRFSASSKTMLFSLSNTSSVTSMPSRPNCLLTSRPT